MASGLTRLRQRLAEHVLMILNLTSLSESIVDGRKEFTAEWPERRNVIRAVGLLRNPSRLQVIRTQRGLKHRG